MVTTKSKLQMKFNNEDTSASSGLVYLCFGSFVKCSRVWAIAVVSSNPVHGEVYSMQHYVIKCASDLGQVVGLLWIFRFPPLIKLTATIYLKYCWKWRSTPWTKPNYIAEKLLILSFHNNTPNQTYCYSGFYMNSHYMYLKVVNNNK